MKFIFVSDLHLRNDIPICRVDDFLETQIKTINFIKETAVKNNAVLILAGDIFNKARPDKAQELEILLLDLINNIDCYIIAGQHDLLFHRIENINKGSIGVLLKNKNVNKTLSDINIQLFNFGEEIKDKNINKEKLNIAVIHKYCDTGVLPEFMSDSIKAEDLCKNFNYDIFITGDNHHGFIYQDRKTKKLVFNNGCITRQASDLKNYKPFIILFNSDDKTYNQIFLPDNDISAVEENFREEKNIENRIDLFIKKMKDVKNTFDLDFKKNLINYCKSNNINDNILKNILISLGE